MVLFYDLAGAEAPTMRRVYTEYVLPESRCPGKGRQQSEIGKVFDWAFFLKLWKCIATLDGHPRCYPREAQNFTGFS